MNTSARSSFNLFTRWPLLMYFVLAYAFFWGFLILVFLILGLLGLSPSTLPAWVFSCFYIIGSWMPNIAAVTVTGLTEGRAGNRKLLEKYSNVHIPARWFLTALAPIPLMFAAAGLYNLAGGTVPGNQGGQPVGFWISLIVMSLLTGATGEEGGWRGFSLPRLQNRYGPLVGSLILALAWDFWHFPLWMMSGMGGMELLQYIFAFSLGIIGLTFFMTWLYNQVPNSLVPMIIAHFSLNFAVGLVGLDGLGLAPSIPLMAIFGGLTVLTDLLVWTLARRLSAAPSPVIAKPRT
jgi:membrane protease YdiL (CAAX protease family)